MMGRNTLTKVTIVNFPLKNNLGQFVLQNYGLLCFVMEMFIIIRHNHAFQQNSKKGFCE